MEKDSRIYVAGHRGLAGSAITRALRARGYSNLILRTHSQLDLTDQSAVDAFFAAVRPQFAFLAAAKVGGIMANSTRPAEFIYGNLAIQTNVIHACWRHEVRKLLFLGSSCIYPKLAPQPMSERDLLGAPLEPSNEPYAVAKIAGIKMCAAYHRQYGSDFLCVQPTNLYGPNDNYDLASSHVLAAMIRKIHEAKAARAREVQVWGTGTPRREFLYSDDMAGACVMLMERYGAREVGELVNLGWGEDVTIRELSETIARIIGFEGELRFDLSKPDGTPRKLLDCSRIHALGWRASTPLAQGIRLAYEDYLRTTMTADEAPAPRIAAATA
jgi:GDP-L-fucose synthase